MNSSNLGIGPRKLAEPILPLTDWISCTTPPVREGEYELTMFPDDEGGYITIGYRFGKWSGEGVNDDPREFYWRGIRRWVLVQRNEPILGCDAYIEHRTPQNTKWTAELAQAKGFDTEAKAQAYRDHGRWPFGLAKIEAVLP